jgi:hypothetical protein
MIISDTTALWAREAFRNEIANLLDDPSIGADEQINFRELRIVARDLDLRFDVLVDELGSPYEIARFREIEAGQHKEKKDA